MKHLTDSALLDRTEHWAREERRATAQLIEHLREVERRKLYCDLGCTSLAMYCRKILKLSEASAQRRIDAMRLSETLPEVKQKLESGELPLTAAARLHSFI